MKVRYIAVLSLLIWSISAFSIGELPALSEALKPVLTEKEFNDIYAVDDLDMQAAQMQKLLSETVDVAKKAALKTAIAQTLQLKAALDQLMGERQ